MVYDIKLKVSPHKSIGVGRDFTENDVVMYKGQTAFVPLPTPEQMRTMTLEGKIRKAYHNPEYMIPVVSHETIHGVIADIAEGDRTHRMITSSNFDDISYFRKKVRPTLFKSGIPSKKGMMAVVRAHKENDALRGTE